MELGSWLVAEHDDAQRRLSKQILEVIPAERRRERLPGGNSVDWTVLHLARHASLALRVLGHDPAMSDALLDGMPPEVTSPSAGLQEAEQPWLSEIETPQLEAYALSVLDEARAYLSRQDAASLDVQPDVATALRTAGVDEQEFGWLYEQWAAPHVLFRWPLTGHIIHHVGELTGVRNQLGLRP
jgi:hypothetical protein